MPKKSKAKKSSASKVERKKKKPSKKSEGKKEVMEEVLTEVPAEPKPVVVSSIEEARHLVQQNPSEENLRNLADECLRENRMLEAYLAYERVIGKNPKCEDALVNQGKVLLISEMYEESTAAFKKAEYVLSVPPSELYYFWGLSLEGQKLWNDAIKIYEKAIEKFPHDIAMYYRRIGVIYKEQGHYNHALTNFRKAMALDARDQESFYFAGVCYAKKAQYEEAIEKFRQAIKIDPVSDIALEARKEMANAMLTNHQVSEALQELSLLAIIFPNNLDVLHSFADALLSEFENNNIEDKSEELYGVVVRMLELDPNFKPAHEILEYLKGKDVQAKQ